MYYSLIGALAFLILSFENHDILFKSKEKLETNTWVLYRSMLLSILFFYATDMMWGILDINKLRIPLFADTSLYFFAMAICVWFLIRYVITYLNVKNSFGTFLLYSGRVFCFALTVAVIINCFIPILFEIDEQGMYHALILRYVMLAVQIILLILLSMFAFRVIKNSDGSVKNRFLTIAYFAITMAILLFVQAIFPLYPFCAMGYMLGTCLLRTFVVYDEKEEYKRELEKMVERERKQLEELQNARIAAYKDPLTGVKSKSAYAETEQQKNSEIQKGSSKEFAIAVFDLNNLKTINDTYGHEKGDEYIKGGCRVICQNFKHSPVYRVGGDEFVALLEGEDYNNRVELEKLFTDSMFSRTGDEPVVAMGISEFVFGKDYTVNDVFVRADQNMYHNKSKLKNKSA